MFLKSGERSAEVASRVTHSKARPHLTGSRVRDFHTLMAASPPPEHTCPVQRATAFTLQQWPCAASVTAMGVVTIGKPCTKDSGD